MPEGHTLHKAAQVQRPWFEGAVVRASSPQGRFAEAAALDGARLVEIEPIGKHLFYRFESGRRTLRLHVHLGLAGRFRVHALPAPVPRTTVRLRLVGPARVLDLSGPLVCELLDDEGYAAARACLGPDPIQPRSRPAAFQARVRRSRAAIGTLLLDQSVIAGVGNVYRAELLYLARIDPRRPGRDLAEAEVSALWTLARVLLRAGVTDGRIITTRHGGPAAPIAPRGQRTYAYKRRVCVRCDGAIDQVTLAGRRCFFCPRCQA